MADNTTELEVLDQIVEVLGGQSGQYETVVPVLQQIKELLGGGGSGGGYNPSLSVGRADALTGADSTAQWATRESTGSGAATVRSVQGNAVVWNQLAPVPFRGRVTSAGITYDPQSDGSVSLSGTTTQTVYERIGTAQTVVGHKYVVYMGGTINSGTDLYIYNDGGGVNTGTSNKILATATAAKNMFVRIASGATVDGTLRPQAFDLTEIFGAGNEPQSVAEFEAMYPESYYPYSAPTLKPVQIAGIRSTTEQGGELDAIEWSTFTLRGAGSIGDMLYSDHVDVNVGVYTFTGTETLQNNNWEPTDDTFAIGFPLALIDATWPTSTGVISNVRMAELETIEYGDMYSGTKVGICLAPKPQASAYSLFVRVPKTLASDKNTLMAWLAGKTIFYALATPTTTPISPALPMTYKVQQGGSESIIVPDGEVSAAPLLTVAEGESAADVVMDALACIATPDGPVATANHAINTYLTMGGKLYKVTSAIAVGETIKSGTNVSQTTVMAELIARTA